jgi:hypothetical protein
MNPHEKKIALAMARTTSQNVLWLVRFESQKNQLLFIADQYTLPDHLEICKSHLEIWLKSFGFCIKSYQAGFILEFDSIHIMTNWWAEFGWNWLQKCQHQLENFKFNSVLKKSEIIYLNSHIEIYKSSTEELKAYPPAFYEETESDFRNELVRGGIDTLGQAVVSFRAPVLSLKQAPFQICLEFSFWEWLPQPHAIELFLSLAGASHCRSSRNTLTVLFKDEMTYLKSVSWVFQQSYSSLEKFPWLEADGTAYEAATVWNWTRNGFGFSRFAQIKDEWHIHLINRDGKAMCNLRFDTLEEFFTYRDEFTHMAELLRPSSKS